MNQNILYKHGLKFEKYMYYYSFKSIYLYNIVIEAVLTATSTDFFEMILLPFLLKKGVSLNDELIYLIKKIEIKIKIE